MLLGWVLLLGLVTLQPLSSAGAVGGSGAPLQPIAQCMQPSWPRTGLSETGGWWSQSAGGIKPGIGILPFRMQKQQVE